MSNPELYTKIVKTYHLDSGQVITIRANEDFTKIIAIRN